MIVKALRKKNTKEFVEIIKINTENIVFTSELPILQPMSATIDLLKEYYSESPNIIMDNFELVELLINEIYL